METRFSVKWDLFWRAFQKQSLLRNEFSAEQFNWDRLRKHSSSKYIAIILHAVASMEFSSVMRLRGQKVTTCGKRKSTRWTGNGSFSTLLTFQTFSEYSGIYAGEKEMNNFHFSCSLSILSLWPHHDLNRYQYHHHLSHISCSKEPEPTKHPPVTIESKC